MTESPDLYCLHPSHIYDRDMPPCEALGIERLKLADALAAAVRRSLNHPSLDTEQEDATRAALWAYLKTGRNV